MDERLKLIRKHFHLSQESFADRLGIKRSAISNYEIGRNVPIDAVVSLICREFNISETWLRTGEGEMFVPAPSGALDAFIRERNLSPSDRVLIDKFATLDAGSRQAVVNYVLAVADAIQPPAAGKDIRVPLAPDAAGKQQTEADAGGPEGAEVDIMSELAELKRQNQALAAKVAAMEEEERDEQLKADFGAALSALQSGLVGNSEKRKK